MADVAAAFALQYQRKSSHGKVLGQKMSTFVNGYIDVDIFCGRGRCRTLDQFYGFGKKPLDFNFLLRKFSKALHLFLDLAHFSFCVLFCTNKSHLVFF